MVVLDQSAFFRQATTWICGSSRVETAVLKCLPLLKQFMPVDEINLHLYETDSAAIRTIAGITEKEIRPLDKVTPLPERARRKLAKTGTQDVRIVGCAAEDPVSGAMVPYLGTPESSILILRLFLENERFGALTLRAGGLNRYCQEDSRLLAMLNGPFSIALSHTLSRKEVFKLRDMLHGKDFGSLRIQAGIVGMDGGLREVAELVDQVAPHDCPVLLTGETGVGKEVIADAIHFLSGRRGGPLVKVNCGAIPETLIDDELFGHEKGAFTGAIGRKIGRFERAHGGTIFLDEIGDMPANAQGRLLRVLQDKRIERVGGTHPVPVDIRVIAATHRNLEERMRRNLFREDLWYRLNVFPIPIPPLRERKEDIPDLVRHFLFEKCRSANRPEVPLTAPGALNRLMDYPWPGNVRELENTIERAVVLHKDGPISLDPPLPATGCPVAPYQRPHPTPGLPLDEIIARHIRHTLTLTGGRINGPGGAAALLGVHPNTLRHRMKKLGIPYGRSK